MYLRLKMTTLKHLFRLFSSNMKVLCLMFFCTISGISQAQDFGNTLDKLEIKQREQKEFGLFRRVFPDSSSSKLHYGLSLGANISTLLGDAEGTTNQVGYLLGGFARYDMNSKYSIQVELNYSREGAQQDAEDLGTGLALDSGLTAASRYNYLSVPISIRYYPWHDYGFYVSGGPSVSYLLGAQLQGTGGEFSLTSDDRIDVADRLNKLDLAAQLGIGFTWAKMLDLNVRYKYSFTNTVDNAHNRTVDSGSFTNKSVQVILGFKF